MRCLTFPPPSRKVRAAVVEIDGGDVALDLAALDKRRHIISELIID